MASVMSRTRRAVWIAVILLVIDALFISADVLRHVEMLHDPRFAVTTERGFGEWFQYAKAATIVLLLLTAPSARAGARAWASLFAYLLLDDAFEIHETLGLKLAARVSLPAIGSIRPGQVGELVLYVAIGLIFAVALGLALRHGDRRSWALCGALALPFALLVFFGAVMDVVHSLLRGHSYRYAAGVIEDGGEMVAMSLLAAMAYWASRRTPSPLPSSASLGASKRTSAESRLSSDRLPD